MVIVYGITIYVLSCHCVAEDSFSVWQEKAIRCRHLTANCEYNFRYVCDFMAGSTVNGKKPDTLETFRQSEYWGHVEVLLAISEAPHSLTRQCKFLCISDCGKNLIDVGQATVDRCKLIKKRWHNHQRTSYITGYEEEKPTIVLPMSERWFRL